jgi:replicative DNA helicase
MINDMGITGKVSLWAEESETAVIGAILVDRESINIAVDMITPDMFYGLWNRNIYRACLNLFARNIGIDLITVKAEIERMGSKDEYGGPMHLVNTMSNVSSSVHIRYHCGIIFEKFILRRLSDMGMWMIQQTQNPTSDPFQLLDSCEKFIFRLNQNNVRTPIRNIARIMADTITTIQNNSKYKDGIIGLPSGFRDLDSLTKGWQKGDLIIIAARPSMGKTVLGMNIAMNACKHIKYKLNGNGKVLVLSIEMPSYQLGERMICSHSEIPGENIKTGNLTQEEWNCVSNSSGHISELPIVIDDDPKITIGHIRSKARKIMAETGLELIVIDYLQKINIDEFNKKRGQNREQEVAYISNELKSLAKELKIPVIALAQLGRSVDTKKDKRPDLSDLRESGSIEMDADVVIFPYRPEYYRITEDETGSSTLGMGYFLVAKNRNGPVGDVKVRFMKEYSKFENLNIDEPRTQFEPSTRFDYKLKQSNDDTRNKDIQGDDTAPF